ncbi:hypothetical protein EKK58_01120 [Candidatus Dependentiae bacterium]|nr:MAG: hypothetical protein EKK58_01120 [Candidatus Dependentiae bacterium]
MNTESEVASRIKNVAIAGAGGIGAYLAGFLYDLGVNRAQFPFAKWKWTLFDDDTVDHTNLLHQNFTEDDIGRPKAEIVSERTARVIKPELRFMTTADFPNYDVVFSCVDSMTFRRELYNYGFSRPEFYWVDGRCSSRNIGLFNSKVGEKVLRKSLSDSDERRGCLLAVDKEKKVSHITPVIVASMMAQTFLNHIRGVDTTDQIMLVV